MSSGVVQVRISGSSVRAMAAVLLASLLAGCATLLPRDAVSQAASNSATLPGMAYVRFWGDVVPHNSAAAIRSRMPNLGPAAYSTDPQTGRPLVQFLALSGGGADGAYGAGLLVGWSRTGKRPRFEVVTGISAGALIAPFAFLGPAYDRQLKDIWTNYGTDDLIVKQPLNGILGGPALADVTPLSNLLDRYVNARMLRAIAAEYRKGRLLLVGTTNLDAQRPVIWNMGEIAASGHPKALELFRNVLLASSAIPGAFPPVQIEVEADGKMHDEMHVDGGVSREVFLTPAQFSMHDLDKLYPATPVRRIYIIKNGPIKAQYQVVQPTAVAIAARSIYTLIKAQAAGDLFKIYINAQNDGAEFYLAAKPETAVQTSQEPFDKDYMRKLFQTGYGQAARGYQWMTAPPELAPSGTASQ